jgi:hypothetical protein
LFVFYSQKRKYMYRKKLLTKSYLIIFRFLLFLAAVAFSINLKAQNDTIVPVDKDPEELLKDLDLRKFPRFNIWNDRFKGNWSGFDVGINLLVNPDYSGYDNNFMQNEVLRSNSAYINLLMKSFGLQSNRNTIGLVTGVGLHLQSYRFEKSITLELLENGIIEPRPLFFDHNQKSKLSIVSFMIPLLAEFQIPVNNYNNRIHISGGLYSSVRLDSHTKIKYRAAGKKEKLKTPGHYSLRDIKYGLMFRTGYRWVNVFATYELVPLFKDGKGPKLTPVTFGVTLLSF